MGEVVFILIMVIFLIAGYVMMGKVDNYIENSSEHIWVIYDQSFLNLVQYQCQNIIFIEKDMIQNIDDNVAQIIIATKDDYYNLMMHYHLRKCQYQGEIYAFCAHQEYRYIYQRECIHLLDNRDEVKGILEKLYENHI